MFDPATFFGTVLIGVLGSAAFRGLQLAGRRIARLDLQSPYNIILCVIIGVLIAVFTATAIFFLCLPHLSL